MNVVKERVRRGADRCRWCCSRAPAPRAPADPNAEKARAHFQQGDTYFKLEKYANALQEFEQAYLAKQDPSFLYNIAQCHRLMGNRAEAVRFYKRYLNDAPNAANRPVAEKHIRDLESALGAEELTGAHPAHRRPRRAGTAPGGPGPGMPPPQPDAAPPPVALGGAGRRRRVGRDADKSPPPSQADDSRFYTKWWFWTGVGGGRRWRDCSSRCLLNRDPSCPVRQTCQ